MNGITGPTFAKSLKAMNCVNMMEKFCEALVRVKNYWSVTLTSWRGEVATVLGKGWVNRWKLVILITCCGFEMPGCNFLGKPAQGNGSGEGNIGVLCLKFRDTGAYSGGGTYSADGGFLAPEEYKAGTGAESKAMAMPDTNSFILSITDSRGESLYKGSYSKAPESIIAQEGSYDIRVVSRECSGIEFDGVQWGDEQCVTIQSGQRQTIELVCRQLNSGIKLSISPDFLTSYPDGVLFVKNSEGKAMYGYSEKRTAYFSPGNVSLVLNQGTNDKTIFSRNLSSGEILSLAVNVAQSKGTTEGSGDGEEVSGLKIEIDTTRSYLSESITLGEDNSGKGSSSANAFTIAQAKNAIGSSKVWVAGYIVGGDLTSKSMVTTPPFASPSCLAIGPKASTSSKDACIAVQLGSGSKVREEINLVDNPDMFGKYIILQGDIVASYFGIVGLKNVSACVVR